MEELSRSYLKQFSEFKNHKAVYRFEDAATELKGFIAIHNDNLGPATGGTRMFPYPSEEDALRDVLKLSRAMTYKCTMAGVRHGGGKAVIIGNPNTDKTERLIRAYARKIGELKGVYSTGEDVGISEADVQIMMQEAPCFVGKTGVAGDPSPFASKSTFLAMQSASEEVFGGSLQGKRIAVKGIGKVGGELIRLLVGAGAHVTVADIRDEAVQKLASSPSINKGDTRTIHAIEADIFAPCAMGGDLTLSSIQGIKAKLICGAANNQLASDEIGDALWNMGKIYIPDYVANMGGLINVVDELEQGGYSRDRVEERIQSVVKKVKTILRVAKEKNISPHRIADTMAESIFMNV
ncbi:MAG: Glu/Leu/Phe/Val dehydrogenase dimerization domain-containing protein [Patescibacteria group bacterium]